MRPRYEARDKFGPMRARLRGAKLENAVQEYCDSTGLARQDIADAAGVSRSTIYNRLSDARRDVSDTMEKATVIGICSVIGAKYDDVAEDVT